MKVLILGTSHVSCLRHAQNANPKLAARVGDLAYAVTPGSTGPYFSVLADGHLQIEEPPKPQGKPFFLPEGTQRTRVVDYDTIVLSALGATAAVNNYKGNYSHPGLMHRFGPKPNSFTDFLMSEALCKALVASELENQHGAQLLRQLASCTKARLIVQPYPLPSAAAATREDWTARILYEDPHGAHRFYNETRIEALSKLCQDTGAILLDYPSPEWAAEGFTPERYVNDDLVHTNVDYGVLVLEQLARISEGGDNLAVQ